jgi:hypothetical protein
MTEKVRRISGGMTEDLGFQSDDFTECLSTLSPTMARTHGLFVEPLMRVDDSFFRALFGRERESTGNHLGVRKRRTTERNRGEKGEA